MSLKKIWLKIFDKDKYRDLKNFERKKINLDNYHSNIYKKILEIRIFIKKS